MAYDDSPRGPTGTDEESEQDSREQGVDIGPLADVLEDHSYPTTTEEIVEQYGDYEIDLEDGTQTLREVFEGLEDQQFESKEDVRQMIYNMVGAEAVGRARYSDRGGIATDSSTATGETDEDEQSDSV
ncbi:DUF5789 family protein [Haloferax namakaokahaiae]|uniref:DUF5789 family protein n=1 Tax=Haloferax namakaokahaiae TaxID=1748331 RepID=A0ABD5ZDL5_9EURY